MVSAAAAVVVVVSAAILRRASWRNCCDAVEIERLFVSMIHNLPEPLHRNFLRGKKGMRDRGCIGGMRVSCTYYFVHRRKIWGRGRASYSLADGAVPLLARFYALYWSAGTYKAVLRAEVEEEDWHMMKSRGSIQTTTLVYQSI